MKTIKWFCVCERNGAEAVSLNEVRQNETTISDEIFYDSIVESKLIEDGI